MNGIMIVKENGRDHRKMVNLSFDDHYLFIMLSGQNEALKKVSIQSLEINIGGSNDSLLFISSVELGPDSLYLEATKTNLESLKGLSNFKDKLKTIDSKLFKSKTFKISVLGLVLFVFGLVFYNRQQFFGSLSFLIPFSVEQKVADKVFKQKLSFDQKQITIQLENLFGKLQESNSSWHPKYTLHISSDLAPNAYATIGGHVFVNKGLILLLNNPEDLLGVLAHEKVHIQRRHVVRSLFQGLGVYTTLSFLLGDVTGIAAVLIDQGGPLLSLKYSRELEEEADSEAIENLKLSGVNPEGLPRALEAIQMEVNKLNQQIPGGEVLEKVQSIEILNSHPEMETRISRLKKLSSDFKDAANGSNVNFDYEKFKSEVKDKF